MREFPVVKVFAVVVGVVLILSVLYGGLHLVEKRVTDEARQPPRVVIVEKKEPERLRVLATQTVREAGFSQDEIAVIVACDNVTNDLLYISTSLHTAVAAVVPGGCDPMRAEKPR